MTMSEEIAMTITAPIAAWIWMVLVIGGIIGYHVRGFLETPTKKEE